MTTLGAAARNARLTDRQLADFADRVKCAEVLKLRVEAAELDLPLPRYLAEIIAHRPVDLIRQSVQTGIDAEAEAGEGSRV